MWWLILEACSAFFIFVFIVWWTMFSGRKPDRTAPAAKRGNNKDGNEDKNEGDRAA